MKLKKLKNVLHRLKNDIQNTRKHKINTYKPLECHAGPLGKGEKKIHTF